MKTLFEISYDKEVRELTKAFETEAGRALPAPLDFSLSDYESYFKLGYRFDKAEGSRLFFYPLNSKDIKLLIRQFAYHLLRSYYGFDLPYGLLLGIRPVKLLRSLIRETGSKSDGAFLMQKLYFVDGNIVNRLLSIYELELPYLSEEELKKQSLYLSIAFCPSRCYYCSFPSNDIHKKSAYVKPYMNALKQEFRVKIQERLAADADFLKNLDVLYIGGGTPSSIPIEELESLFNLMEGIMDFSSLREFSFEAGRVDTLSPALFELLRKYGVSRLSINPQTMKTSSLESLGRKHSVFDVAKAFEMARNYGFHNINSDLILGLRDESIKDMEASLDKLLSLEPESITLHSLAIKKGSVYAMGLEGRTEEKNTNAAHLFKMQEGMMLRLLKEGYRPYYLYRQKLIAGGLDNIGFAKKGHECVYNIRIMEEEHEILGLGAGARSKLKEGDKHLNIRNPKDLEAYISKFMQNS